MRFVIATLPDLDFQLGRDLSLIKTCALYGEESVLFSPNYVGSEPLLDFSSRPLLHQLDWLLALQPNSKDGLRTRIESIYKLIAETKDLDKANREIKSLQAEIFPVCKEIERALFCEKKYVSRAREISKAEKMGLVKIENKNDVPSFFFNKEQLVVDIKTEMSRSDSYGVLDERFFDAFNDLSPGISQKLKSAHVANNILERLPSFSTATLEEIFDIRNELEYCLIRFRKALINISLKIQAAPWDQDFPHDVERELQLSLKPSVEEIEEQIQSNSYLKEIVHRAVKDPLVVPATSAFGLILSSTAQTPALIGQVASALCGAGLLAFEAHKNWEEAQSKIQGNEFFFYYRASILLKKHQKKKWWSNLRLRRK